MTWTLVVKMFKLTEREELLRNVLRVSSSGVMMLGSWWRAYDRLAKRFPWTNQIIQSGEDSLFRPHRNPLIISGKIIGVYQKENQ